jgi:hypothetical protein
MAVGHLGGLGTGRDPGVTLDLERKGKLRAIVPRGLFLKETVSRVSDGTKRVLLGLIKESLWTSDQT